MNLKTLLGISGCSIVIPLAIFVVVLTALLAMVIPQLPFGQEQAWQWMLGTPQPASRPPLPSPDGKPIISGNGEWCVMRAYQETPEESHLNAGRVQGYVRGGNGQPLAGIAVHVSWDGDEGGITQVTEANGYYVFILSPGDYHVQVAQGQSQVVSFRTNIRAYYGHYTYDVDFVAGRCSPAPGTPTPRDHTGEPASVPRVLKSPVAQAENIKFFGQSDVSQSGRSSGPVRFGGWNIEGKPNYEKSARIFLRLSGSTIRRYGKVNRLHAGQEESTVRFSD